VKILLTPILFQGVQIKAQTVSCESYHTFVIQSISKGRLLSFNEAAYKLNIGEFIGFEFLSKYQSIPHNPINYIATFYDNDRNVYLVELQYDQSANQILFPL
jgi:hypothetical protein